MLVFSLANLILWKEKKETFIAIKCYYTLCLACNVFTVLFLKKKTIKTIYAASTGLMELFYKSFVVEKT